MLLRITAIIVLLCFAAFACSGSGDQSATAGRDQAAAGVLDAKNYRAEIEALESILYKDSPADFADIAAASGAMMKLYGKAMERETRPVKIDAAQRLLFLSARADVGDIGYAAPDLGPVRTDWERVRRDVFGYEEWFHNSSPEVARSQAHKVPEAPPMDVHDLKRVIERLENLIDDGRRECDALGEPVYNMERMSREGEEQVDAWRDFYRDWDDRIDYIAGRLPAQPSWSGNPDFSMAYQAVVQAMGQLRLVPVGVGEWPTPFRSGWESRFQQAEYKLDEARDYLTKIR